MNEFIFFKKSFLCTIFSLFLILGVTVSCKKYTTPNRVSKVIVVDSWTIQNFFFEGASITTEFSEQVFSFEEGGSILAKGIIESVGIWSVGLNKNPATLYLSNFLTYPMSAFNDDWTVDSCSKKEIKLSSGDNSLVLKKVDN